MIKLELSEKPIELTEEVQEQLVAEFIKSEKTKDVYKKSYIEKAVKKMAFGKCCFSEINLDTKSTYTEIEHFHHKNLYPEEVVKWGNLLPSSKTCNTTKGQTDTKVDFIINPFQTDPKEHIYFFSGRLYSRLELGIGRNTIDLLSLNNRIHFTDPRIRLSLRIIDDLQALHQDNFIDGDIMALTDRKRKNQINKIKGILGDVNRKTEFSACVSTEILNAPFFKDLISVLIKNQLWDQDFKEYLIELKFCYLGK